jgi:hypothetical protein
MLANVEDLPIGTYSSDESVHKRAKELLFDGKIAEAWAILRDKTAF